MSTMNIKNSLKEARDSINLKNYQLAIKICKEILQQDANNYMANIFLGACYQESDKNEALKFLKAALKTAKDPTLALQGLLHCVPDDEMPEICAKLLELPLVKYGEIYLKLISASRSSLVKIDDCINILYHDGNRSGIDSNRKDLAFESIVEICLEAKDVNSFQLNLRIIKDVFKFSLNINRSNRIDKYKMYFKILSKSDDYEMLYSEACNMIAEFPDEFVPYEWICKLYCDSLTMECKDKSFIQSASVKKFAEKLITIQSDSSLGYLALGLLAFELNDLIVSRQYFNRANELKPKWAPCVKMLAEIYEKFDALEISDFYRRELGIKTINPIEIPEFDVLHRAENFCVNNQPGEALNILITKPYNSCRYHLQLGRVYYLLHLYPNALENYILATQLEVYNATCFYRLAELYHAISDPIRERKCLEKCVFLNPRHKESIIMLCAIYRSKGEYELALHTLETAANSISDKSTSEWSFQRGLIYLAQRQYESAIKAFRDALKQNGENDVRIWIGLADSYFNRGAYTSALKVYQKIIDMEPTNTIPKLQLANVQLVLRMYKEAVDGFQLLYDDVSIKLPVLKGLADGHFGLAVENYQKHFLGRCSDHLQSVINYLVGAIELKPNLICLRRLLVDVIELITKLPVSIAAIQIPVQFIGGMKETDEMIKLKGRDLLDLTSNILLPLANASNLLDKHLTYDIARSYYQKALLLDINDSERKPLLQKASVLAKEAIKLNPSRWLNWNLLGVISTTNDIDNRALAQHCFIKAIEIEKKCSIAWSNLGTLYLQYSDIELANRAFGFAQQFDTEYINGWTGQALIAENVGADDEAIELFHHCTNMGYTAESALGYAHWVCQFLNDSKYLGSNLRYHQYIIEHLHAVPAALDSIKWYCMAESERASIESLSYLAFLCMRMKQWTGAIKAYLLLLEKVNKTNQSNRDKILCNLGYAYLKNQQPNEAAEAFHLVTEATHRTTIGLALAYFKAAKYQDSYSTYESALNWLAETDAEKVMILIAMSSMVYAFRGDAEAKSLLYQCIEISHPPVEALYSACALGILHNDIELSAGVLTELLHYSSDPKQSHHVAFLASEYYFKKEGAPSAFRYLFKMIHTYPNRPFLRTALANFILRHKEHAKLGWIKNVSRLFIGSMLLNRIQSRHAKPIHVARSLAVASYAVDNSDKRMRKIYAQKAILMDPSCKEAWASLVMCCRNN